MVKKRRSTRSKSIGHGEGIDPIKKPKGFCYWENEVLVLNILGTPSAKTDKICKPKGNQLKISVKAKPQAGKATDYMVNFLSNEFGVRSSAIEVVFGRTNVNKQLRIQSPKILPAVIDKFLNKKCHKLEGTETRYMMCEI